MTVAVVGNCQVDGLAAAILAYNPDVTTIVIEAKTLLTQHGRAVARVAMEGADKILAMELISSAGEFNWAQIKDTFPNVTMIPTIVFEGHFPDIIYLDPRSRGIQTLVGQYHSRIILAGYLSGRSPRQTERLFNALVYSKLGYFDAFPREMNTLVRYLSYNGFELSDAVDRWQARGCFMHSSNHPKKYVIADLAVFIMNLAAIPVTAEPALESIIDTFENLPRFPVYPEIAQRLGFEGSLDFVGTKSRFGLSEFVHGSYELYSELPRHALICRPVEHALALLEL